MQKRRVKAVIYGLGVMLMGTTVMLTLFVVLNKSGADRFRKGIHGTEVYVQKINKQVQIKKKAVVKKKARKAPARPKLSLSLSAANFSMPGFDLMAGSEALLGDIKDVIMTASTVDKVPQLRAKPNLEFPAEARAKGLSGYVTFNLLINNLGRVEQAKVLESHPEGVFDQVAIASIQQSVFAPAEYKGSPVKVWAKQKVRFDLN